MTALEIAGKLTEAQRRALIRFTEEWCSECYADLRTLQALDRRGLTSRYTRLTDFRDVRITVTALGNKVAAAVRSLLKGNSDANG